MIGPERVNFEALDMDTEQRMVWQGKPFTGTAIELTSDGKIVGELNFVDGVQDGLTREWSLSGRLIAEEAYSDGSKHGYSRHWFDNGQLSSEQLYEYSIKTKEVVWSNDGNLISKWEISENDQTFSILQMLRQNYAHRQTDGSSPT
jgi:antitoxin component YwqK of YwqJK toxin-antitoxin module